MYLKQKRKHDTRLRINQHEIQRVNNFGATSSRSCSRLNLEVLYAKTKRKEQKKRILLRVRTVSQIKFALHNNFDLMRHFEDGVSQEISSGLHRLAVITTWVFCLFSLFIKIVAR